MNTNFDHPSFQDQVQSPAFNPNFQDSRALDSSGNLVKNHSNFLDSSGHPANINSKNQSNFQSSPTKQHFDTAYHNLIMKLSTERPETEEQALISKLLLSSQVEEDLSKHHLFSRKNQDNSSLRLSNQAVELKAKHSKLAEDLIQRELKECSFNPEILVNTDNETHRSLPQFLASQTRFLDNKNAKIETMRSQIANSNVKEKTNKPKLCPESLEILKKKANTTNNNNNSMPVYERLYALNKKVKNLEEGHSLDGSPGNDNFFAADKQQNPAENVTFAPKINEKSKEILKHVNREGKPEERLYQDYFSREKKIQEKKLQNEYRPKSGGNQPKISENSKNISQKLIAEAFLKEFQNVSGPFLINGRDPKFDYLALCEIMKNLGFITNTENLGGGLFERERTLLFELWWALKGEEFSGVNSRNLCLFSLGILGLSYKLSKDPQKDGFSAKALPKDENKRNFDEEKEGFKLTRSLKKELMQENQEIKEVAENEMIPLKTLSLGNIVQNNKDFYEQWAQLKQGKIYGRIDFQGYLEIERKDIKEIHRRFELFYRNRLSNETLKKFPEQEKLSFEPIILANSKILASSHREKLTEKTQEFLKSQALETKLPENGEFTHADLLILSKEAQKFENLKKNENNNENLKECTFHPKILSSVDKSIDKGDRNLELFNLSKNKAKNKVKLTNEIEYEKNCQECTFHPDLKKPEKEITLQKVYAKNIDKFINRMRNSQKEREYVNMWTKGDERGFPGKRKLEEAVTESQFGKEFEEKMSIFRESSIKETNSPDKNENEHNFNENLERVPLLFVDVNIGPNRTERIIVNEGDRSEDLAEKFAMEFRLYQFFSKII